MCTVSYFPFNNKSYCLTSNRDEDITRQHAMPIHEYVVNGITVYFPKDPKAGGTWIAHSNNGFSLCLFNGAFEPHIVNNSYRKSRGLVVLDFFNYNNLVDFSKQYNFTDIEPFSLICIKSENKSRQICELKWDGFNTHLIHHDENLPAIWSSVTLYSKEEIALRKKWFKEWIQKNVSPSKDEILLFHHFAGDGDQQHDVVMNRNQKKTVSICCINQINQNEVEMIYEDIVNKELQKTRIVHI